MKIQLHETITEPMVHLKNASTAVNTNAVSKLEPYMKSSHKSKKEASDAFNLAVDEWSWFGEKINEEGGELKLSDDYPYDIDYENIDIDGLVEFMNDNPRKFDNISSWFQSNIDANHTSQLMDYEKPVINQWMVHFTDHGWEVFQQGFKYGNEDVEKLSLTDAGSLRGKQHGDYLFAYLLDDATKYGYSKRGGGLKYGKMVIVFIGSGIKFYHHGDEEPQLVFDKKSPKGCFLVKEEQPEWNEERSDKWVVYGHENGNPKAIAAKSSLKEALDWCEANASQYKKFYPWKSAVTESIEIFKDFMKKMGNSPIMEAVREGFSVIFESDDHVNYVEQVKDQLPVNIQDMLFGIKRNPVISYMQSVGMDKFHLPDTAERQNKFFSIAYPYQFQKGNIKLLMDRLHYYAEDEGLTIDELESKDKELQAEYVSVINSKIERKVESFNKASDIVKSKANVKIESPKIAQMVNSIIENDESDDNHVILRIYTTDPENDIGIAVDIATGKIEIFEENEEADPELLDAVTALISDPEAYETVYSSQNEALCEKIIQSGKIPDKMFFSKNKRYAQGYLQEGRDIITFKIQNKYISRHSDVDWMSRSEAPVVNARYL